MRLFVLLLATCAAVCPAPLTALDAASSAPRIAHPEPKLVLPGRIPATAENARASIANPPCQIGIARWGAADQAGQSNTQTPARRLEATWRFQLLPTSKSFSLAHVVSEDTPTLQSPILPLVGLERHIPDAYHLGLANISGREELITGELVQQGTQLDAFGHVCKIPDFSGVRENGVCYGGHLVSDIMDYDDGLLVDDIAAIKDYYTTGILIDLPRAINGGQRLLPTQAVTVEMLVAAMAAQGLHIDDIDEGDVVLIRTGHEELWPLGKEGPYYAASPGLNVEAYQFLASRCVGNLGADNPNVEHNPPFDPTFLPLQGHIFALAEAGIPQIENVSLAALANHLATLPTHGIHKYEFAFIMPIPRLEGGTGASVTPIAITPF